MMDNNSPTLFREVQRAPKGLRIAMYTVSAVMVVVAIVVICGMIESSQSLAFAEVAVSLALVALPMLIAALLLNIKQVVVITPAAIVVHQQGLPFKPRVFDRTAASSVTVRPCNAFWEFGGWGYRLSLTGVWGYIWAGSHCIDVRMKNRKRFVITVQDAQAAKTALGL